MTTSSTRRRSIPLSTTTTTAVSSAGMSSQLTHSCDGTSRGCATPVRRSTHVGSSVVIYINSIGAYSGKKSIKNCTIFDAFFPLYNLQTFSKTSPCRLQPIKSKFPQKVPDHVTSRSLSTAPSTRHDPCFWSSQGSSSMLVVVLRRTPCLFTLETHVPSSGGRVGFHHLPLVTDT